ncbi:MAG: hypothetical protein RR891_00600 [Clostridium sp.]
MIIIKRLRRTIIAICLFILAISVCYSIPKGKYFDEDLKQLVNEKKAQVIEVGKSMKLDNAPILIHRIINTEDTTYIRYSFIRFEHGWSFPGSNIQVFDDKEQEYFNHGGESSSNMWGEDGLLNIERVADDAKYIIIRINVYDRKNEMKISLAEEGGSSED